ncbi:RHD3/Sey1 [Tuber indicum]|nr:RHD3/Sey1 [Tuber indicum]
MSQITNTSDELLYVRYQAMLIVLFAYLTAQNLITTSFSYHVVAAFGSQSTSKSTLLNHLFGTRFSVMDEQARKQTTKGMSRIWMPRAIDGTKKPDPHGMGNNILVMDVGGEDQDFERKSAFFIVNIWEHQVGLYRGANMGLLKTDRSTAHRSLLFFAIRDRVGRAPLPDLSNTRRIFTEISPLCQSHMAQRTRKSLIFLTLNVALPHKLLQLERFVEEAQKLRKRFCEGISPAGGRIPTDGFPHYTSGMWTQIFNGIMSPFEEQAKTGRALEGLGDAGGRYHKGVFKRKREAIERTWRKGCEVLALANFLLSKESRARVQEGITSIRSWQTLSGWSASSNYQLAAVVKQTRCKLVDRFVAEASESYIPGAEWSNYENELTSLQAALDEIAARLRGEEMKRLVARLEKAIRSKLGETVEISKEKGGLWGRVWKVWTEAFGEGVEGFLSRAGGLNATEKEQDIGAWNLRKKAWGVLKPKIEEEVMEGNILLKLREKYLLRTVSKATDPIKQAYATAREATLMLIPLSCRIRLSSGAEPPLTEFLSDPPSDFEKDVDMGIAKDEFVVLGEVKLVDWSTRFKRMANVVFVEAERSTVSWGLMLGLGWNKVWAMLRSPVYFVFLLLCGAAAYVVHSLNLWGPILQAVDIGRERLRDHVADPKAVNPGGSNRTRGTLDGEGRKRPRIKKGDDDE